MLGSRNANSPTPRREHGESGLFVFGSAVIVGGRGDAPAGGQLLFRTARPDLEPVVTQLVLPVLAIKLPLKVLVVNDNRFLLVIGGDALTGCVGRQLLGLRVQDLELDLDAVAGERAELARQTIDAIAGDLAGVGLRRPTAGP